VTAVFLAADTSAPELESAVAALRANHNYSMTPIMLLDKAGYENRVETLVKADSGTASVAAVASTTELQNAWSRAAIASGQVRLQPDQALALALDAVDALRKLAFSRSSVYDFNMAERALMAALSSSEEILQTSAASVLALSASSVAQQAIANLAMSDAGSESLRLAVFDSLAESAKVNGNMLTPSLVDRLIDQTLNQANLTLRTAASQALGALNLPSNKAGLLISNYRRD
jgi:hypothetical protein